MPAEFLDILKMEQLEIGHSKKVLFSSDHFHTWVHGDYPGSKGPMHKQRRISNFIACKVNVPFIFLTPPLKRSIRACW